MNSSIETNNWKCERVQQANDYSQDDVFISCHKKNGDKANVELSERDSAATKNIKVKTEEKNLLMDTDTDDLELHRSKARNLYQ